MNQTGSSAQEASSHFREPVHRDRHLGEARPQDPRRIGLRPFLTDTYPRATAYLTAFTRGRFSSSMGFASSTGIPAGVLGRTTPNFS